MSAYRPTLRRLLLRASRLLLTLSAVMLVGFYGAAGAAKHAGSPWPFAQLPVFLNLAPQDVRDRALFAMRAASEPEGAAAETARGELLRLGGAVLPHVLPRLDSLEPTARGRVAMALGPLALRMRVASQDDVATPERALLFFGRFWQDRSIEFRPTTVRRAVDRLAERSLVLRRDDVIHADTYALEALVMALGEVKTEGDVARVQRLEPVLQHITGRAAGQQPASVAEAARHVESWRRLWLQQSADYVVLEGPRRVAALVTETQFGKWLAQAFWWKLDHALDGSQVAERVLAAAPGSAAHVLLILLLSLAAAAGSSLTGGSDGLRERASARVALTAASLVASYPVVLTVALAFELVSGRSGVLELCARGLRLGDVNLVMGTLLGITLLSELLVTLPARLAGAHSGAAGEEEA